MTSWYVTAVVNLLGGSGAVLSSSSSLHRGALGTLWGWQHNWQSITLNSSLSFRQVASPLPWVGLQRNTKCGGKNVVNRAKSMCVGVGVTSMLRPGPVPWLIVPAPPPHSLSLQHLPSISLHKPLDIPCAPGLGKTRGHWRFLLPSFLR